MTSARPLAILTASLLSLAACDAAVVGRSSGTTHRSGSLDDDPDATIEDLDAGLGEPADADPPDAAVEDVDAALVEAPDAGAAGAPDAETGPVRAHPDDWRRPTEHGHAFDAAGPAVCTPCHGETLEGGTVGVSCESCHAAWKTACTFCHGNRATRDAAPPEGATGETARASFAVGAHREHVQASARHAAFACAVCHGATLPTSALTPGHVDGDRRAETSFRPFRGAGTTYGRTTGVCGNGYCHGNGNLRGSSPDWRSDPALTCGSCHAPPTGATEAQLAAQSGAHDVHVRVRNLKCSACHGGNVDASGALLRPELHVNGAVEVSTRIWDATLCDGRGGCARLCHDTRCWR